MDDLTSVRRRSTHGPAPLNLETSFSLHAPPPLPLHLFSLLLCRRGLARPGLIVGDGLFSLPGCVISMMQIKIPLLISECALMGTNC